MLRRHRRVLIAEGETDALTLLSGGFEVPGESIVLALAGASIWPKPEPFKDKEIVLVLDPDEAGERAAVALKLRFEGVAQSVVNIPLQEVCRG